MKRHESEEKSMKEANWDAVLDTPKMQLVCGCKNVPILVSFNLIPKGDKYSMLGKTGRDVAKWVV